MPVLWRTSVDASTRALERLLLKLFEHDEFRRFLRRLEGGEQLDAELPGGTASRAHLIHEAIFALKRCNWIDKDFFAALVEERRRNAACIWEVALLWGIVPEPDYPPAIRPRDDRSRKTNLPPFPAPFIGRDDELAAIHSLLLGGAQVALGRGSTGSGALTGLGGIGKTSLACAYAHRHLADYEHICWVNAEGENPSTAFAQLADNPLRLDLEAGSTITARVVAVQQRLEQANAPVLLILDNVTHPVSWRRIIPTSSQIRVLLTTRRQYLAGVHTVPVEVLPTALALRLLLGERTWSEPERSAAHALCEELGFLTLAVALAGRYLERPTTSPLLLLERIRRQGCVVWSDQPGSGELLEKNPSLTRLFDASVDLLSQEQRSDVHARRLLQVGGWFGPVGIREEMLFAAAARLAGTALDDDCCEDALSRLLELGLVQWDSGTGPTFHRLVGAYARVRSTEDAKNAVLDVLGEFAHNTGTDLNSLLDATANREHLVQNEARLDGRSPERHLWIALRLAQFFHARAETRLAYAICERMARLIGRGTWAGKFLHTGAMALTVQGDYTEAVRHLQRAITMKREADIPDMVSVSFSLHELGLAQLHQRHFEDALKNFQEALSIRSSLPDCEMHPDAATLTNIGAALIGLQRTEDAFRSFELAMELEEKISAADSPSKAMTLHMIGRAYLDLGQAQEAAKLLEKALAMAMTSLHSDHIQIANLQLDLGRAWLELDVIAKATPALEDAAAIFSATLPEIHPDAIQVRTLLERCRGH